MLIIDLQDTFFGEILGAVVLADGLSSLNPKFEVKPLKVLAEDDQSSDGKMIIDERKGKLVRILEKVDTKSYHILYAKRLGDKNQTAKVGSFSEQSKKWSHPHD